MPRRPAHKAPERVVPRVYGERRQRREPGWIGVPMATYFCDGALGSVDLLQFVPEDRYAVPVPQPAQVVLVGPGSFLHCDERCGATLGKIVVRLELRRLAVEDHEHGISVFHFHRPPDVADLQLLRRFVDVRIARYRAQLDPTSVVRPPLRNVCEVASSSGSAPCSNSCFSCRASCGEGTSTSITSISSRV